MTTLAELDIKIEAQFDKLQTGLNQVQTNCNKTQSAFGMMAGGIGGLAVLAGQQIISSLGGAMEKVQSMIIQSMNYADELVDTAAVVGMTTDELQKFGFALRLEGNSLNAVTPAVKFLSNALLDLQKSESKASDESKDVASGLARLGIESKSFRIMSVAEQLDLVFRKLSEVQNANDRATITTQIFGRSGMELLPVIQSWVGNQDKLNQMLKDFGIPEDKLKNMEQLKTDSEMMGIAMDYAGSQIAIGMMPALKELIPVAVDLAKEFGDFIKNNPQVVDAFAQIAIAIAQLAEAFMQIMGAWMSLPAPLRMILSGGMDLSASLQNQAGMQNAYAGKGYSYAGGGIAMTPQLAMVAENGPEVIMPLNQLSGASVNIHVGAMMGNQAEAREFARMVHRYIRNENNTRTYGRLA